MTSSADFQYCESHGGFYPQQHVVDQQPSPASFSTIQWSTAASCAATFTNENGGALTAWATIWLTIVTSLLVWISRQQYVTSRAQLRAYIGVDETSDLESRKLWVDKEGYLAATGIMKNFGATPAFALSGAFGIKVVEGVLTSMDFKELTKWSKPQVFQPSQQGILLMRSNIKFDKSEWSRIRKNRDRYNIFVYGQISYFDTFRSPHFARFCFKIDYRNGMDEIPGWDWNEDHNETDDDITSKMYPSRFLGAAFSS